MSVAPVGIGMSVTQAETEKGKGKGKSKTKEKEKKAVAPRSKGKRRTRREGKNAEEKGDSDEEEEEEPPKEPRMIDFCTAYREKPRKKGEGKKKKGKEKGPGAAAPPPAAQQGKASGVQLQCVNGKFVVLASSVVVGGRDPEEEGDYEEVDEDATMVATSSSFLVRERTEKWTVEETEQFYLALQQCGTDFCMMEQLYETRTRKQLKKKFGREERSHPELVAKALSAVVPLDISAFKSVDLEPSKKAPAPQKTKQKTKPKHKPKPPAPPANVSPALEVNCSPDINKSLVAIMALTSSN
ncbi:unnamed protein product [Chrysoparadoxa australica]